METDISCVVLVFNSDFSKVLTIKDYESGKNALGKETYQMIGGPIEMLEEDCMSSHMSSVLHTNLRYLELVFDKLPNRANNFVLAPCNAKSPDGKSIMYFSGLWLKDESLEEYVQAAKGKWKQGELIAVTIPEFVEGFNHAKDMMTYIVNQTIECLNIPWCKETNLKDYIKTRGIGEDK